MDINVEAYVASWIEILSEVNTYLIITVEAYVASWIEIRNKSWAISRNTVEAYVASWIEIHSVIEISKECGSRLT